MEKKESVLDIILVVKVPGKSDQRYEFSQKSIIIGSGPSSNLKIDHESVSSIHAILKAGEEESSGLVSDLGSEEGTSINGAEIRREAVVRRGDRIGLGKIELQVMGVGANAVETVCQQVSVESKPPVKAPAQPPRMPPKPSPPALKREPVEFKRPTEKISRKKARGPHASGQYFFCSDLPAMEQPSDSDKLLEVKVMWGDIVLHSCHFASSETVTIGDSPEASIQIASERLAGETFTLVTPGGRGHVVQIGGGMEFELRQKNQSVEIDSLLSEGAVRTYPLKNGDKCRVLLDQLAFVIQYVSPASGLTSSFWSNVDTQSLKWLVVMFLLAIGTWVAIESTPKHDMEASDYLKNPARFAQLIMPSQKQDKKTFEEIKKKKEEKPLVEDAAKWKKVTTPSKTDSKEIPREVKEKIDRKVATNAGILGLLKGRGGGTGDDASSVFGGSSVANLDQQLAGLQNSGMGDSGGFGGLGTRGGGPGGGGGLGLGGMGTSGYGRGEGGAGYGSVQLQHRGRSAVQVVKGNTKVIGALSQEVVGRYIQRYYAQIKFCYERELTKNPNLYGKITVTFTISGNGKVTEAQTIQTSMHNANVEECILRVIRRMVFPQPKGGGQVIVTYPFLFTLAG